MHHQRDRVGFVAFDSDIVEYVPSSAKHMETILHVLERLKPGRPGNLKAPLHKLAEHFGRRGVLVVVSDFYEEPEAVLDAVSPLRFRGNDLIVFHVLDPSELEFGFGDAQPFEDLESGEQMPVVPEAFRAEYRSLVQAHVDALAEEFFRSPGGLHAARYVEAARSRAVQVPEQPIADDEDQVIREMRTSHLAPSHPRTVAPSHPRTVAPSHPGTLAMQFLAPLFFVALAGLAIPVLLHLTQREKKQIIRFPSLMFVRRIPYQSVRRRKVQNWLLLFVRMAALALLIAAFARPFIMRPDAAAPSGAGAREVVVLLDTSYSMGYGDRWERARKAAEDVVSGLSPSDRGLDRAVCVGRRDRGAVDGGAREADGGAGDRQARLGRHAIRAGAQGGREHPVRLDAAPARGGVDQRFPAQRMAWRGGSAVAAGRDPHARAGEGPLDRANVGVTGVSLPRSTFSDQERVTGDRRSREPSRSPGERR